LKKSFIYTGFAFSLLFLTACSTKDHSATSINEGEGMASLLAATIFVREQCRAVEVPSDTALMDTLSKMSTTPDQLRTEKSKSLLSAKAGVRYVALMRDEAPLAKKCASLVPLTDAFIQQSRQTQADK